MNQKPRRPWRQRRGGGLIWLTMAACVVLTLFGGIKTNLLLMKLEDEAMQNLMSIPSSYRRSRSLSRRVDLSAAAPTAMTTTQATMSPNATIVVQLSGEMGNNLHKIAFARGLQLQAQQRGVSTNLILRHGDDDGKWKRSRSLIVQCFPQLSHLDFTAGNTAEYRERILQQKMLFGGKAAGLLIDNKEDETVTRVLNHLQHLVVNETTPFIRAEVPVDARIRLPMVISNEMVRHTYLDRFKNDFQHFFAFDDEACCAQIPEPDESVFHFRNFQQELKGVTKRLGFRELNPRQTAEQLFGRLKKGDKVAMISRFKNDVTQQYVQALEDRALQVRLVSGQSPVEDFCFLKRAQKEMVGSEISSFFVWAAYLGSAPVRSYFVEDNREAGKESSYPWQDLELRTRYSYESYRDEDHAT